MSRLEPYLGSVIALLLGVFIVTYPDMASSPAVPAATTTLSVLPSLTISPILPDLEATTTGMFAASSTQSAPAPKKAAAPVVKKPAASPASTTPPATVASITVPVPTAPLPSSNASLDASATNLRSALVNIICYAPAASGLRSISGSGVFIDSKGIILTNAHIAQYFLLADRGADCTIRAGSPAVNKYDAALIYISQSWLRANSSALVQAAPSGTGQYDFALLAVTKSATSAPLPASFPAVLLAITPPEIGTPVVIATYGAQFLEASQIQSSLSPTVVFGSVKDIYTFNTNTVDVLALGGSAAAQEGSSGGGVADAEGKLVATITTSTISGATNTRALSAITASYIRAEYASEMGRALDLLLAEATSLSVAAFAPKIPTLEAILAPSLR